MTNKKGTRLIELATAALALTAIVLCLKDDASYALAYREQQQLFLYDWAYVHDLLLGIGGFASLTARFLVQFFFSRALAVGITALCIAGVCICLWLSLRRRGVRVSALPTCLIPAALLCFTIADNALHFDALVALFLATAALCLYARKSAGNLPLGCAISIILFLLAGPAALVFAICAFILDFGSSTKALLYALPVLVLSAAAWLLGMVPTFAHCLGPQYFHEQTLDMAPLHLVTWLSLPASLLLARLLGGEATSKAAPAIISSALAAIAIVALIGTKPLVSDAQLKAWKYEYLTERSEWKELEKEAARHMERYADANYCNLAKARQGRLLSELFRAPQHGPYSLIYIDGDHSADPRLAYVLYAMGNMAASQGVAFNGLQSFCGYKPSMLKMCCKIEIMRGSYEVAGKYLSLLDKSLHYRVWAQEMRTYMSDEAVAKNAELSLGRADMQGEECFVLEGSPMNDLFRILDANPADECALQYGLAFLLLSKDIDNCYEFIDKHYGTSAMQSLDVPAQEALIFFWDYYHSTTREYALAHGISEEKYDQYSSIGVDYCRSHGVSEDVFRRFSEFKAEYGKNRGAQTSKHRNTFWHYMLFSKI